MQIFGHRLSLTAWIGLAIVVINLLAANTSVQSVSQLLGPSLFTLTFAYFIGEQAPTHLPGAPFFLASALVLLALGIAWRTLSNRRASA